MKLVNYWGPTIGLMALIFFLSSRTRVHVSDDYAVQFLVFKSLHVIEYGLLYVLAYRSFKNTSNNTADWKHRFHAFLIAVAYGITDEIHQVFVPTREGRMRDVFIDTLGVTIAFYIVWKLLPKAPKRLKNLVKKLDII